MNKINYSIKQLRQNGFKVMVYHERDEKGLCETEITVTSPNGLTGIGRAKCYYKDNYNRKIGNKIALGRALELIGARERKLV